MDNFIVTPFQQRVLETPEEVNLALPGGRGGGKSTATGLLNLRHGEQYGQRAKMLYVRRTFPGMRDYESLCLDLFGKAYGSAASFNHQSHTWRFPHGGTMEMQQIESHGDLQKMQGRSMTLITVDECGQYPSPDLPNMLRANMRGAAGMPLRMIFCANPGGVGQSWFYTRFIAGRTPWKPWQDKDTGQWWVTCPSTLEDNSTIDQEAYRSQLQSACASDPELLKAWLSGDFTSQTGAYFGSCIDYARNAVEPLSTFPFVVRHGHKELWDNWLAFDHGSSRPAAALLMAESPGCEFEGRYYPRGSILIVDEFVTYRPDDLNAGFGWTAAEIGEELVRFCSKWGVKPQGSADDAIFSRTGNERTINEEYARVGVRFKPAKKGDRVAGWQLMRRMLAGAGQVDMPGLYISKAAVYWWQTIPFLPRCPKRVEDLDSTGADHAADATRYGLLRQKIISSVTPYRV